MAQQDGRHGDWNRGRSPFKGAVLGLVVDKPGHGYELANRLRLRLGPGWSISAADIYPVLTRLERAGLVTPTYDALGPGQRQAKVVYHATDAGVEAFDRWMRSSSEQPPIRNELMVKIAVARHGDLPYMLRLLDDAERDLLELLESSDDDELAPPEDSWLRHVVDIERYHTYAHWRAELHAIVRAREHITAYQLTACEVEATR
jgi:DNA-binding PadR family transcriptional regulator